MIVRKIKPEELKRTNELFGIAFEFETDTSKSAQEVLDEVTNTPKSRGDYYFKERWAAFEDDDKTMMGFIVATPFDVQFDGNICKMTGMGGVSSLPQYRRHGGIRKCFEASIKEMYENDYAFSYLYPFSNGYYSKFGYELCCEAMHYTINLRSIKRFDIGGECCLIEQGSNCLEEVKAVYNGFKQGYNLMVEREDYDYGWVLNADPAKERRYTYLYKNEKGEPKGVMSFTKEKAGDRFNMQCNQFMFSDMEGFKGLLNLALTCATYYEHILFQLPLNINITSYIPEWAMYSYKRENFFRGMVRAVNVQKVLKLAKYRGTGSLTLQVTDNILPQNNHTFTLNFKDGTANGVCVTDKKPDIEMDIRDFSRLIVGTHDTKEICYIDGVKVHADEEKIGQVFYKKLNFISDYF